MSSSTLPWADCHHTDYTLVMHAPRRVSEKLWTLKVRGVRSHIAISHGTDLHDRSLERLGPVKVQIPADSVAGRVLEKLESQWHKNSLGYLLGKGKMDAAGFINSLGRWATHGSIRAITYKSELTQQIVAGDARVERTHFKRVGVDESKEKLLSDDEYSAFAAEVCQAAGWPEL